MSDVWQKKRLDEIISLQRGHDLPTQSRIEGNVPIMGSFGITGWHNEYKCKGPGVTIGRSGGSMGIVNFINEDYWPLNTALYITDFKGNDPFFTSLLLGQVDFMQYNSGSAQPSLNRNIIYGLELNLPPLPEQKAIAYILGTLDDKIELNRQMNQTLEAMAQALFKSWFVAFDPVMDNALAAGSKIPNELQVMAEKRQMVPDSKKLILTNPELAAKFPSSFVFNETLGKWIPEGWEVKKAEEIAKISIGKTPPRKEQHWFETIKSDSNYTWVSIKNMGNSGMYISDSDEYLTAESVSKFNVNKVPSDTVILSFKMTVGRVAITTKELCTNEAIAHFVNPKHSVFSGYIYQYLKIFDYESLGSTSSIATAVNSKLIKQIPFLVPSAPILSLFKKSVTKINKRILETQNQTETLTQLRDRLLPELISGRMRVPIDTK